MIKGRRVLAVIPARGGSKGIPKKNLARIGDRSLIEWTVAVAKRLNWIDRAVLSTDDDDIANEGKCLGVDVPFMRPPELSTDYTSAIETWQHAWHASESYFKVQFDLSIWLQPTSPFRNESDVTETVTALIDHGSDAAVTLSRVPAHYTPHKSLTLDSHRKIHYFLADGEQYDTRQKIPPVYTRNGHCYAITREQMVRGKIIAGRCMGIVIDRPTVNIDDRMDLQFAEFLLMRGVVSAPSAH